VSENRALTRIFVPKRYEVIGEWRKLHKVELNDVFYSPYIIRVTRSRRLGWMGYAALTGERRGVHKVLTGKPQGTQT
jgi:hypothetical protein